MERISEDENVSNAMMSKYYTLNICACYGLQLKF